MVRYFLPAFLFLLNAKLAIASGTPDGEQRLRELMRKAEAGDTEAEYKLGELYRIQDDLAFTHGDPHEGLPIRYSPRDAEKWLLKSAEQGNVRAQRDIGFFYLDDHHDQTGTGIDQNYHSAAIWLRKAAEQGDPSAQNQLSLLYETGRGVPQDYHAAYKWYEEAAKQGLMDYSREGSFFEYGRGVKKDYAKAAKLYLKGAVRNVREDQFNLSRVLAATNSKQEAYFWLLASGHNDAKANELATFLKGALSEQQTVAIKKRVGEWSDISTDIILLPIELKKSMGIRVEVLEDFYEDGPRSKRAISRYVNWRKKRAEQGDPSSQELLADFYEHGIGVQRNIPEAIKWYKKGADRGEVFPAYHLGLILAQQQDFAESYFWLIASGMQDAAGYADCLKEVQEHLTPEQRKMVEKRAADLQKSYTPAAN